LHSCPTLALRTISPIQGAGTFGIMERQPGLWVKCYPTKRLGLRQFKKWSTAFGHSSEFRNPANAFDLDKVVPPDHRPVGKSKASPMNSAEASSGSMTGKASSAP